jgi:hypothetical protein
LVTGGQRTDAGQWLVLSTPLEVADELRQARSDERAAATAKPIAVAEWWVSQGLYPPYETDLL